MLVLVLVELLQPLLALMLLLLRFTVLASLLRLLLVLLLTLQHAGEEEASMAEIAYELLLAHDNEDMSDQGRVEDFVEQCKVLNVIASSQRVRRRK